MVSYEGVQRKPNYSSLRLHCFCANPSIKSNKSWSLVSKAPRDSEPLICFSFAVPAWRRQGGGMIPFREVSNSSKSSPFLRGFLLLVSPLKTSFSGFTNKKIPLSRDFDLFAEEEVLEPYSIPTDYQYFKIGKFLYSPENSPIIVDYKSY